jgi:hypothetical protein
MSWLTSNTAVTLKFHAIHSETYFSTNGCLMMKLITSIAPRPQVLKKTLQVVIWLLVTI